MIFGFLLLVPFLVGRITAVVLEIVYPTPELPSAAQHCQDIGMPGLECQRTFETMSDEAKDAVRSLARARAMTRITLIVIGAYYVALMAGWFALRRRRRTVSDEGRERSEVTGTD